MSQHLLDTMLDQEIAEVAGMTGEARREAGLRLGLRIAARQGALPSPVEGIAVNGAELRMFVVRDADGRLQVEIERQPDLTRRIG